MKKCRSKSRKSQVGAARRVDPQLQQRIRELGPQHVGLLVVDSGKRHFAIRLSTFCHELLWEPEPVPNNRIALEHMVEQLRAQMRLHELKDLIVGIERTGRWHHPIKQLMEDNNWTVKMIHPFATKCLRQPDNRGRKTDSTDMLAMARAVTCYYGTDEAVLPDLWLELRNLSRARAHLVQMRSTKRRQACCQMEALIPGYTDLFPDVWTSSTPATLIRLFPLAQQLARTHATAILEKLAEHGCRSSASVVERVRLWAAKSSPADRLPQVNHRILCDNLDIIDVLTAQIDRYETDMVRCLVQTPLVLLLSITGINVVSACEYGSEMGPHQHYLGPKNVTGRAGLFPARHQSDQTDQADGPVVGGRNERLRQAILNVAKNLLRLNPLFRGWAELPDHRNMSSGRVRILTASRFVRISFCMLRGAETFNHPLGGRQDSVLCKLIGFGREHRIPTDEIYKLSTQALLQLPADALQFERQALLANGGNRYSPRPARKQSRPNRRRPEYVAKLIGEVEQRIQATQGGHPPAKQ